MSNFVLNDAMSQIDAVIATVTSAKNNYEKARTIDGAPLSIFLKEERDAAIEDYREALFTLESIKGSLRNHRRMYAAFHYQNRPKCCHYKTVSEGKAAAQTLVSLINVTKYGFWGQRRDVENLHALIASPHYLHDGGDVSTKPNERSRFNLLLTPENIGSEGSLSRALIDSVDCSDCVLWVMNGLKRNVE